MLRTLANRIAQKQQVLGHISCSNHVLRSQTVGLCRHGPSSSLPQYVQQTTALHSMSASASAMVSAARQCSAAAAPLPSFSVQSLSTLNPDCSANSERLHHRAREAAQLHRTRVISSTAPAAESMSKDKTDLSAGAAAAAAAQTMRQQPSAHGLQAAPQVAKVLGIAGAIPFLALAPPIAQSLPFLPADLVANAALLQLGYGASIASFLGGIHWAMAMAEYGGAAASARIASERYIWSVTPCLMAWPAVALQPGPGSLILGTVLGVVYAMDRSFAAKGLLPAWYMALRLPLTLAAVSGMGITLVGSLMASNKARAARH